MNKDKIIKEVEKRFDASFPKFTGVGAPFPIFESTPNRGHIKQFLVRELENQREELIKKIEGRELLFSKKSDMWHRKGTGALYTNCGEIAKIENQAITEIIKEINKS